MTAALAAVLGVAAIALVVLGVAYRRRASDLRRERQRVDDASARYRSALDTQRQAEMMAEEADGRAREVERRRERAERRALDAEMQLSEAALRRADASAASNRSLLALERRRLEREWADVVGPGVAPPVEWDGSLRAAVVTELAVIRETMGAPGELGEDLSVPIDDPANAALVMRLTAEILRLLARDGGELRVALGPGHVRVEQDAPDGSPAGLAELVEVADHAGAELSATELEGRLTVLLRLPGSG